MDISQENARYTLITDWSAIYILMQSFFTGLSHDSLSRIIYMSTYQKQSIVVTKADNIVSFANYHTTPDNNAWLDYLIISPEHREKGAACITCSAIISECKLRCIEKISLSVVKNNIPAINLYRKIGFICKSETKDNEYVMEMTLDVSGEVTYHKRNVQQPGLVKKIIYKIVFQLIKLSVTVSKI